MLIVAITGFMIITTNVEFVNVGGQVTINYSF